MPIKPENKHRYPPDWREIRERILERAGHRCENCGVINHAYGFRQADGSFVMTGYNGARAMLEPARSELRPHPQGVDVLMIVLTIAHLDHVPEHCGDDNLRAWCQRCHLAYDAEHHAQTAYTTRRQGKALGDLFMGIVQT